MGFSLLIIIYSSHSGVKFLSNHVRFKWSKVAKTYYLQSLKETVVYISDNSVKWDRKHVRSIWFFIYNYLYCPQLVQYRFELRQGHSEIEVLARSDISSRGFSFQKRVLYHLKNENVRNQEVWLKSLCDSRRTMGLGLLCILCVTLFNAVWSSSVISSGLYADPSKAGKIFNKSLRFFFLNNFI